MILHFPPFLRHVVYPYLQTTYLTFQPYFLFVVEYIHYLLLPCYDLFIQYFHPLFETLLQTTYTIYQTYLMILYIHLFFTILYALLFRKRFIHSFCILLPFTIILLFILHLYPLYPYLSFCITFSFLLYICLSLFRYILRSLIRFVSKVSPFTLIRKQNDSETDIRLQRLAAVLANYPKRPTTLPEQHEYQY